MSALNLPKLILTSTATQNEHPLPTDAFPGLNEINSSENHSKLYRSYPVTIPQNTYSAGQVVNPYIVNESKYTNGTVFIIVGSIMGLIFLLLGIVWLALEFRAWRSAKHRQSMGIYDGMNSDSETGITYPAHLGLNLNLNLNLGASELEFGSSGRPTSITASLSSMASRNISSSFSSSSASLNSMSDSRHSGSANETDISEKIIREKWLQQQNQQQGPYQPIYKTQRNSSSTLNLLASNPELMATARNSLFVSPTEILRNELAQPNLSVDTLIHNSIESSPTVMRLNQFVPAGIDRGIEFTLGDNSNGSSKGRRKGRHFRSPSAHLDELLARDT